MTPFVYNVAMGFGVGACSVGAALQWGPGAGLMVAGGLVILATAFGALFTAARRR